jgi:hypothetical protein
MNTKVAESLSVLKRSEMAFIATALSGGGKGQGRVYAEASIQSRTKGVAMLERLASQVQVADERGPVTLADVSLAVRRYAANRDEAAEHDPHILLAEILEVREERLGAKAKARADKPTPLTELDERIQKPAAQVAAEDLEAKRQEGERRELANRVEASVQSGDKEAQRAAADAVRRSKALDPAQVQALQAKLTQGRQDKAAEAANRKPTDFPQAPTLPANATRFAAQVAQLTQLAQAEKIDEVAAVNVTGGTSTGRAVRSYQKGLLRALEARGFRKATKKGRMVASGMVSKFNGEPIPTAKKHRLILDMISREGGATYGEMKEATGWAAFGGGTMGEIIRALGIPDNAVKRDGKGPDRLIQTEWPCETPNPKPLPPRAKSKLPPKGFYGD